MVLNCTDNTGYGNGLYGFNGYGGAIDFSNDIALHDAYRNTPVHIEPNTNFEKLNCSLLTELDRISSEIQDIAQSHDIDNASGASLDALGRLLGLSRTENESDDHYRERIKLTGRSKISSGTTDEMLEVLTVAYDTGLDHVFDISDYETNPATWGAAVESAAIGDISLTTAEIETQLEKSVPAGHRVSVDDTCEDIIFDETVVGTYQVQEPTCIEGTLTIE